MLKAPGTRRFKPKYDELLLSFAFNFNLRRYTEEHGAAILGRALHIGVAGGVLRTRTRSHNGARLTFRVDAHTDARARFVVESSIPSYAHVPSARFQGIVYSTSVETLF